MTGFLKNLMGRAQGTLEVVQPRIPSIYEPYRRGGGLLGSGPGFAKPHAEPELRAEPEAPPSPQSTPNPPQIPNRSNTLQADREGFEAPPAPIGPQHTTDKMFHSAEPQDQAWPALTPRQFQSPRPPVPTPTQASPVGSADPVTLHPSVPQVAIAQGPALESPSNQASRPSTGRDPRPTPLAEARHVPISGPQPETPSLPSPVPTIVRPPLSAETDSLAAQAEASRPAVPRVGQPAVASRLAALNPPQGLQVNQAVRPPLAPRREAAHPSAARPAANPSVQVSIGKVEVRAVFPEPAVRPAPARPSRPTVSLQDYLHRRQGGEP